MVGGNRFHSLYLILIDLKGQEVADKYYNNVVTISGKGGDKLEEHNDPTDNTSINGVLNASFTWGNTPEGNAYWNEISRIHGRVRIKSTIEKIRSRESS